VAESSDSKASDSNSQSEVMPPPAEAAAPIGTGKEEKTSDEDNKENNANLVNVVSS
jgi:targeting protein for Xklp2